MWTVHTRTARPNAVWLTIKSWHPTFSGCRPNKPMLGHRMRYCMHMVVRPALCVRACGLRQGSRRQHGPHSTSNAKHPKTVCCLRRLRVQQQEPLALLHVIKPRLQTVSAGCTGQPCQAALPAPPSTLSRMQCNGSIAAATVCAVSANNEQRCRRCIKGGSVRICMAQCYLIAQINSRHEQRLRFLTTSFCHTDWGRRSSLLAGWPRINLRSGM